MNCEDRKLSVDQFYANKLKTSEINLDTDNAWVQFENIEKQKSAFLFNFWKSIIVIAALGSLSLAVIILLNDQVSDQDMKENKSSFNTVAKDYNESKISSTLNSLLDNGVNDNNKEGRQTDENNFQSKENTNDVIGDITTSWGNNKQPFYSEFIQQINQNNDTFYTSKRWGEIDSRSNVVPEFNNIESVENDLTSIADKNLKVDPASNSGNYSRDINLLVNEIISPEEGSGSNENKNTFELNVSTAIDSEQTHFRKLQNIDLLPYKYPSLTLEGNLDKSIPSFITPLVFGHQSRWSFDLGLTFGNNYSLNENFTLEEINTKIRLSHFALSYGHIQSKLFNTYLYLSYDKIYGEKEFVGVRIVRIYQDDNISLGYGFEWSISPSLSLESSVSFGLSVINKVEFEQKPTYIDGIAVYKDYTESRYNMNPTMTYQNHTKLKFRLFDNIKMFVGSTYRSQFVDQLSSSEMTRENTLSTFSDIQFIIGLSYCIN